MIIDNETAIDYANQIAKFCEAHSDCNDCPFYHYGIGLCTMNDIPVSWLIPAVRGDKEM